MNLNLVRVALVASLAAGGAILLDTEAASAEPACGNKKCNGVTICLFSPGLDCAIADDKTSCTTSLCSKT
jgi:hypothetical protein